MKKLLILLAAVALVAWVISWFWADEAVATSAAQPWPGGKGELEAVFERFPPLKANEASRQLTALASGLPRSEAEEGFVRREI